VKSREHKLNPVIESFLSRHEVEMWWRFPLLEYFNWAKRQRVRVEGFEKKRW